MRIGDAAVAAGMTPRALRYYEQQGLVTARRTPSGHRVYDAEDIRRLRVVRALRDAGLTVGDVRTFAHLLHTMPADDVPDLLPRALGSGRCSDVEAVARRRLADLDARIERLSQLRARLAARLGEPVAGPPEPGNPGERGKQAGPGRPAGPGEQGKAGPGATVRAGADSGPIFRLDAVPPPGAAALRA
ncbi:DNA-binding transcriptional regulator, MerR family [Streptomyces sp. 2224.1]|uniref:MerR family transcriptional regulator n=1 Tax=unclassified Streptomyces TaxID=2593676 RepID=UPI00088F5F17|nr:MULTISPECIES: MerR family transcriptional regulator [unclassified Streptomyces]PBC84763.1 DNA-binding transcriptional MerR regulator [Streptomyces sp. 2321.6]SDR26968.1 DNA-binding transcriptional regulator, MerR family [Streptomyces sp. KS_16]SEB62857.1 DNA-binding transcriptional regulator, MerR family [Streptomyces sp. 2224.1]SED43634.1 DNA-binding transcriptional regulator, MerR family [Streptomyces sp. 2133.1]SNC70786.1 DNA-binding transcriptional regulator, MerR family [Streptomyces s